MKTSPHSKMYGIQCFVSDHEGFFGKFKVKCEDFEVKEIDSNGIIAQPQEVNEEENENEAQLDESCKSVCKKVTFEPLPSRRASISAQVCHVSMDETNASPSVPIGIKSSAFQGDNGNVANQKVKIAVAEDPEKRTMAMISDDNPFELLKDLLDSSVLAQLDSVKFDENTNCLPSNLKNLEISLGIVSEKGIRTILHQCVRYVYPYLKTAVSKTSDGQCEVKVLSDNAFGDFIDTGVAINNVGDLFRFIHCQMIAKENSTFVVKIDGSKEQRTQFHRLIRQNYGSFLESKTFCSDEETAHCEINVRFRKKRKIAERPVGFSEKSLNPVYKFVLCKRNIDTSDAILKLSHLLKTKPSAFSFAGTKDKKAITYQYVTSNEIEYEKLDNFAKTSKGRDVEVFCIKRSHDMLRLGDLTGNLFKVVLHDVRLGSGDTGQGLVATVKTAVSNVTVNGFVNYFGEQRFGLEDNPVSSSDVGLAMLNGDFVKAVDLILSPTGQGGDVDNAKKYFQETRDVAGASKRMPLWKAREVSILRGLKQHGYSEYGCCQALLCLPYNARLMYVHSYCSLLWNKMASMRIKMLGMKPAVGDMVFSAKDTLSPIALREKDIMDYCVSDIVLPLPGFRVTYPENLVNDYERVLQEDGLKREHFRLRKLRLNIPGVYRKLISYPQDIWWNLETDVNAWTEQKDIDKHRATSEKFQVDGNLQQNSAPFSRELQTNVKLELKFSLVSSSYATVCLRELMHNSPQRNCEE